MVIVELISAVGSLPITVNLALSPGMEFGLSDLPLSLSNGFSYVLMKKYHPAYFRARGMSEEKRVTAMSLDPAFTAFRSYVVWHVSVFFPQLPIIVTIPLLLPILTAPAYSFSQYLRCISIGHTCPITV